MNTDSNYGINENKKVMDYNRAIDYDLPLKGDGFPVVGVQLFW